MAMISIIYEHDIVTNITQESIRTYEHMDMNITQDQSGHMVMNITQESKHTQPQDYHVS